MWRWEDEEWADDMCRCDDEKVKMRRWYCADAKMRRCDDEKMILCRCEDGKMIYRPPTLEEPFAQTLSGKVRQSHMTLCVCSWLNDASRTPRSWATQWLELARACLVFVRAGNQLFLQYAVLLLLWSFQSVPATTALHWIAWSNPSPEHKGTLTGATLDLRRFIHTKGDCKTRSATPATYHPALL